MIVFTNRFGINPALAVWLLTDDYDHNPDKSVVSATTLLKPPRMVALQRRFQNDTSRVIEIDISTLVKSRMGQAIHSAIEQAWLTNHEQALRTLGYSPEYISRVVINPIGDLREDQIPVYIEQRGTKQVGSANVTGKFDFALDGLLQDTKSTSVYSYIKGSNDEKYCQQGSIYRYLMPEKLTKDFIKINYIFTDFKQSQVASKGYPPTAALSVDVPLMSMEQTEQFIKARLDAIEDAVSCEHQHMMPLCSDEDLWKRPTIYKYYKKASNVRATQNDENYDVIKKRYDDDGGVGRIEVVEGKAVRCDYCLIKDVCEQYRSSQ